MQMPRDYRRDTPRNTSKKILAQPGKEYVQIVNVGSVNAGFQHSTRLNFANISFETEEIKAY